MVEQAIFRTDLIDYRELSRVVFNDANVFAAEYYARKSGKPLAEQQLIALDQGLAIWALKGISPFEIESALVAHPAVAEAGVIGKPHELYGSIIKAFVILKPGFKESGELKTEIIGYVRNQLSFHEAPREIEFVTSLPKTKSGKIMRRVLRAKEMNIPVGDISTMDSEMATDIK